MGVIGHGTRLLKSPLGDWATHPDRGCAGADPDKFFPAYAGAADEVEAKTLCARRPVKRECLEYALNATPMEEGIWGGTSVIDRQRIRQRRAREQMAGAA